MNEYTKQAETFLKKANATCNIEFEGCTINRNWKEKVKRNFYNVVITTPRGSMSFTFWDSIYNTEISKMTLEEYSVKRFKRRCIHLSYPESFKAKKELKEKKAAAVPNAYAVLTCLTKYDPGTFENFCLDYGYDEDSRTALNIYLAVSNEWESLSRIFTAEQIEELCLQMKRLFLQRQQLNSTEIREISTGADKLNVNY